MVRFTTLIAAGVLFSGGAFANADAPPWGHSGAPGGPDCTACHFDGRVQGELGRLRLTGINGWEVGKTYRLTLNFTPSNAQRVGFLVEAVYHGTLIPAGTFLPADDRTEAKDNQIRSTEHGSWPADPQAVSWTFDWTAPFGMDGGKFILLKMIANAGNGDESPLGDQIYGKGRILLPASE